MLMPNTSTPAFRDANTWKVFMGITEENQDSYRMLADYASAPADEAWVYACVKRLYTAAQSVPLRVYQYQADGLDLEPVIGVANPAGQRLQHLLDWVNPVDMNGSDLKAYTMASWAVWGGCYWKKVRGKFGGEPQELYWLRAPDVHPTAPDGRRVLEYEYRTKTAAETIVPKDLIAFRDVNLSNQTELLSPLSAARNDISVQRQAAQHTAAVLKNWGVPAGAWVVPKGEEITTSERNIIKRVLGQLRGPANAGKSAILPAGLQWQTLAMNAKDAEWISARRISRMTVCAVLGVPLVLAGDDDKLTTYASLRDARKIFWEDTVVPRLDWIADQINGWLVPDFDPSGQLKVAFDYTNVVALKEPDTVEKNTALAEVINQVRTPNEYRSVFRVGKPLSDGNRVTPKTTVTLRPDPAADPALLARIFPAMSPVSGVANPPQTAELFQPGGAEGDYEDLPASLRAFRRFYSHPSVRAFIADGGPLDTAGLGLVATDEQRAVIEAGIARRNSAAQIADLL